MKKAALLFLLFTAIPVFAQKEANNWFFGWNAGIHFMDDGSVIPLDGSLMVTNEGCSSISDSDGNLLFYTDGRSVWDRNHMLMPNGDYFGTTGLLGDPSSTQSGIIVPKKNDPNIYYIFTVDEPHHQNAAVYPAQFTGDYNEANGSIQSIPDADDGFNNGLNYSVVDLSIIGADGNIGDITTRNVQLYTYNPAIADEAKYKCSEKVTAVKNQNGTGFWVVTQFIDKFYSFYVDQNGVNETPVISQITPVVPVSGYRRNAIGCIKASPNGKYIAIAHNQLGTVTGGTDTNGCVYLYNFDNATGIVSNPVLIKNNVRPYGIEFSPLVKKLYIAYDSASGGSSEVMQYDMLSSNIPSSGTVITTTTGSTTMQLGPNGKIYKAVNGGVALDVINSPEEDGTLCDYQAGVVALPAGSHSVFGLPPFITSLFSGNIIAEDTCMGEPTVFSLSANSNFDSVSWNFGDSSASVTADSPQHTYAAAGNYNVIATVTRDGSTEDLTKEVTVNVTPVANTPPTLTSCDTDNDGFAGFTLTDNTAAILGTQSATAFTVRYFATQADADANTQPLAAAYTNTANPQTIFARVQNNDNTKCYAVTSFALNAINTPVLSGSTFAICDDATDGSDTNGKATFTLPDVTTQLVQGTGFTTTYYLTQAAAEAQTSPIGQTYYNTTANSQTIYARIVNTTYTTCFSIEPITLTVNPLPDSVLTAVLVQCDLGQNPNGISLFNLAEADSQLANNAANRQVAYYPTVIDAENDTNVITGGYTNLSNPQTVYARVINAVTNCYRILPLNLEVNIGTVPAITLEHCDDDGTEDGLTEFNLTLAGLEDGTNNVVYYPSANDALLEQNAIGSAYTNTTANQQSVYGRIEANNQCSAVQEIILIVRPLPDIEVADTAIVCLNTREYVTIDAGTTGANFSYLWSTGATTRSIKVNQPGIYTVKVTDVSHATLCYKERIITVSASNLASIDDIVVEDLRDNNTVTIYASPTGNVATTYMYSLDHPTGPWQESPYFDEVAPGIHTLYIYDTNGCGIVKGQVAVLAIPKFFTPNGDSSHDYWHITGINGVAYTNSKLYIFDRYGKLLSDVDIKGPGWDGLYHGNPLPSTDYWFELLLVDGRVVKGHFSMVR